MSLRRATVCLLVGALLVACSGDDDDASPTTSTDSVESTSTTDSPSDADVLAAYRGFWDAYLEAGDPMDPAHPALERYASGASLARVRESFAEHFSNGEVIRGSVELSPEVEQLDGETATVRDCYLDRTHLFDTATGEQVDPPGDATFEVVATLVLEDGAWKVSTLDKVADGCER